MTAAGLILQSRWIKGDLARSAGVAIPTARSLRPTLSGHTTSKTRSERRPSIHGAVRQKNFGPRWTANRQKSALGVVGGAGGGGSGGGGFDLAVVVVLLLVLDGGWGVVVLVQVLAQVLLTVLVLCGGWRCWRCYSHGAEFAADIFGSSCHEQDAL